MLEDELIAELVDCAPNTFYQPTFSKEPIAYSMFSLFAYSVDLVLINKYGLGNQQHCLIHKLCHFHDEVQKAVADFLAS